MRCLHHVVEASSTMVRTQPVTKKDAHDRELLRYVRDLWTRGNPDDIQLLLLTLINAYLAEVPLLQNLRAQVRHASPPGTTPSATRGSWCPRQAPFCHLALSASCRVNGQRIVCAGFWHSGEHGQQVRTADPGVRL